METAIKPNLWAMIDDEGPHKTLMLALAPEERAKFDTLPYEYSTVVVTDLIGNRWELRRADCGAGCRCACACVLLPRLI